ncbi:MAG TPA: hypothetical protein PL093_02830 [Candidatus Pacearchaeota archaeon]|jgi:hypothetical protein|nr:hypothetical protein [Candidatus Pacearchaeota archaeon]HPC30564.1 hypothetical protein [Candidatus Pacearchaeota archaeon]HQG09525.1 hypothetical protein [Candidatus Pacearchaeota archaeon]HQH20472.1 hypothetical protein [Candidatus Pacearchaeota archaeon]HRU20750.1 hypothetical protein [Candidatus Paceibacterota bacterium]
MSEKLKMFSGPYVRYDSLEKDINFFLEKQAKRVISVNITLIGGGEISSPSLMVAVLYEEKPANKGVHSKNQDDPNIGYWE